MDRNDEKKDRAEEVVSAETPRDGDILGLSGAAVPKAPDDPSTEYDEASVAKRRARALGKPEPEVASVDPDRQGGATGIDMGAGGQSTFIRGE